MTRVVQFLHPGLEHSPDRGSPNFKSWNYGNHRRKFIQATGLCTAKAELKPRKGIFTFWGEWEPQSSVSSLNSDGKGPRWIHIPQLDIDAIMHQPPRGEWQNSDPFVFGKSFLYGVCRQFNSKYQTATKMAKLDVNDIILFGSHIGGNFALDTVFVVAGHEPLTSTTAPQSICTELYKKVTVDRIRIPNCGLRLYSGQEWDPDYPFSFVPCCPADGIAKIFTRPILVPEGPLNGKITPGLKQNFKISSLLATESRTDIWNEVVRQVTKQGCALGTHIDEPSDQH
jgi:hypothetical protein